MHAPSTDSMANMPKLNARLRPATASGQLPDLLETRGSQTGPRFPLLIVSDDLPVAHGCGDPPASPVEGAIGIRTAIGRRAVDLQRQAIIQRACDRPAGERNATQFAHVIDNTDGKLAAPRRFMMPMHSVIKGTSRSPRHRNDRQPTLRFHHSAR